MAPATATLPPPDEAAALPLPVECLPNYDLIVTEDDSPLVNLFSERQAKLLSDALYVSWTGPGDERPFLCMGNVGLFYAVKQPPLVPDFLLSLDVETPSDVWPKENRSYFIWNFGKAPDVVVEVVSNTEGGEADSKLKQYAKIGVPYYVIFDPLNQLGSGVLQVLALRMRAYEPIEPSFLPGVGLGLTLWSGHYAGVSGEFLRWCDRSGRLLPTGEESAVQERQRADQEQQRAEDEHRRAERLAAQLRSLGIEPVE